MGSTRKLEDVRGPVDYERLKGLIGSRTEKLLGWAEKDAALIFPISRLLQSSAQPSAPQGSPKAKAAEPAAEKEEGWDLRRPLVDSVEEALAAFRKDRSAWLRDEGRQKRLGTALHLLCLFSSPPPLGWPVWDGLCQGLLELGAAAEAERLESAPAFLSLLLILLDQSAAAASAARNHSLGRDAEWRFLEAGGGSHKRWTKFTPLIQKTIEDAFRAGKPSVVYTFSRRNYTLDFATMLQFNRDSHVKREVTRVPKDAAVEEWKDKSPEEVKAALTEVPEPVGGLSAAQKEEAVGLSARLLAQPSALDPHSLEALLRLTLRLSCDAKLGAKWEREGGLRALLDLPASLAFSGAGTLVALLARTVLEQEEALEKLMEKAIRLSVSQPSSSGAGGAASTAEIHSLLHSLGPVAAREPRLFANLALSALQPAPPSGPAHDSSSALKSHLQRDWLLLKAAPHSNTKTPLSDQMKTVTEKLLQRALEEPPKEEKEGTVKKKWLLSSSASLRLLAELCRSMPGMAIQLSRESKAGGGLALEGVMKVFLEDGEESERLTSLQAIVATLASLNQVPEAQASLVSELKAALGRALAAPPSPQRHPRIRAVLKLISTAKEHCPDINAPTTDPANPPSNLTRNSILRLIMKKKLVQDMGRIPLEVKLDEPGAVQTINAALKPLEELTRLLNPTTVAPATPGAGPEAVDTAAAATTVRVEVAGAEASATLAAPPVQIPAAPAAAQADDGTARSHSSSSVTSSSSSDEEPANAVARDRSSDSESGSEEAEEGMEEDGEDASEDDDAEEPGLELNSEEEEDEEQRMEMEMQPVPMAEGGADMGSENSSEYEDMAGDGEGNWDEMMDEEGLDGAAEGADVEWLEGQLEEAENGGSFMAMDAIEDALQNLGNLGARLPRQRLSVWQRLQGELAGAAGAAGGDRAAAADGVAHRHPLLSAHAPVPDRADPAAPAAVDDPSGFGGLIARQGAFRSHHNLPISFRLGSNQMTQRYERRVLASMGGARLAGGPGAPGAGAEEPEQVRHSPAVPRRWVQLQRVLGVPGFPLAQRLAAPLVALCRQTITAAIAAKEEQEKIKKAEDEAKKKAEAEKKALEDQKKKDEEEAAEQSKKEEEEKAKTGEAAAVEGQEPAVESGEAVTPTPAAEAPAAEGGPVDGAPQPTGDANAGTPSAPEAPAVDEEEARQRADHAREVENYRHMLGALEVPFGVDPAFLAALPEAMRAEVIEDHHRQERIRQMNRPAPAPAGGAVAASASGAAPAPINAEFLEALPAELQEEVLRQQERERAAAAAAANPPPPAEDAPVDQTAFLESLPPTLRRHVLADMDDAHLQALPQNFQNEARELRRHLETQNLARIAMSADMEGLMGQMVDMGGMFGVAGYAGQAGFPGIRIRGTRRERVAPPRDPRQGAGLSAETAAQSLQLPRGLQLVDRPTVAAILLLSLSPRRQVLRSGSQPTQELNRTRLQKILKHLCSHPGTRDWVLSAHLALLEKALSPPADQTSQVIDCESDGQKASGAVPTGQITITTDEEPSSWVDSLGIFAGKGSLDIPNGAELATLVLDSLAVLGKTFPAQFLPAKLRGKETETTEEPTAKPTPTRKDSQTPPDIWALVQLLHAGLPKAPPPTELTRQGSVKGTRGYHISEQTAPRSLEESGLGRLMAQLANPEMRAEGVLPRLLRLLTSLLQVVPHHSVSDIGGLEGRLGQVIRVMASGGRSEEDQSQAYLLECVRVFQKPVKRLIVSAVADSANQLSQELQGQLGAFRDAMHELPETKESAADSKNAALAAEGGGKVVRSAGNRLGGAEAVISAGETKTSSSVCPELQLPAVAPLTEKLSCQARLLDLLNILLLLRKSMAELDKAIADDAKDKAKKKADEEAKKKAEEEGKKEDADAKDGEKKEEAKEEEGDQSPAEEPEVPTMLTEMFQWEGLWSALSECLERLGKAWDPAAVLVLQPAAEVFFLVHAPGPSAKDDEVKTGGASPRPPAPASPAPPSPKPMDASPAPPSVPSPTAALVAFAEKHRKMVNQMLRQNGAPLADGPFAVLIQHSPNQLDFDIKEKYFRSELKKLERRQRRRDDFPLRVRRAQVFQDSFRELFRLQAESWKSRFYIIFEGEEGQDAGGLLREWYLLISQSIFNPDYGLFKIASGDGVTYMINPASYVNHDHLDYFKFVGRLIAKAILDNKFVTCYFTRAFYKHILAKSVKPGDLESEDPEHYKSLRFLLENKVEDLGMELNFSIEVEEFGKLEERELKPGGKDMSVTDDNKREYLELVCKTKMTGSIRKQLDHFLAGFYDLIPRQLISVFNEQELELLIAGLPEIDLDDLEANTEYHRYTATSPQVQWLWRALRGFQQEDQAKFLQFVTGTSKVPLRGFAHLEGMNGTQKFSIHRDDRAAGQGLRLPSAHTCFNQLDLPVYEDEAQLTRALLTAVQECHQGFGFA